MPILIILLIAILVAQFGFWNTFASILGAVGVLVLLWVTGIALFALLVAYVLRRRRGS